VSGVDASSSASLAAYINSLTYAIEDNSTWFSKGTTFKVRNGTYWYVAMHISDKGFPITSFPDSCFNAFSRVDVRVDVRIPGGVHAYAVDLRGERYAVLKIGNLLSHTYRQIDKTRRQTSGKRSMSLQFYALFYTPMTLHTGSMHTADWIPSLLQRPRIDFCKLQRRCSPKVLCHLSIK
jgi:hypothetical protein